MNMATTSHSPPPVIIGNSVENVQTFMAQLLLQPDREPVASELEAYTVLQSIYGENAIQLWRQNGVLSAGTTVRYVAVLNLPPPHEDVTVKVLVSLPPSYPSTSPPQLQLLSRYIGAFGADSNLFGSVLRTFISTDGVEWAPDTVCVFDGLQAVLDRCVKWYQDRLTMEKAEDFMREDARNLVDSRSDSPVVGVEEDAPITLSHVAMPEGTHIFEAETITDRKSAFVGRACRISHPSEVPLILNHLMSDRRISRAAHPIINAWRCQVGPLLHQDNDDDGETAAGGRLAHLLQILEVNNVLVIVTRYFGGIHLGPDRFKHINQAARNALELGGFLDMADGKRTTGRGKKH